MTNKKTTVPNPQIAYRDNVGMVIIDDNCNVLCFERKGAFRKWQFPQGGIDKNESAVDAMYRELFEETGIKKNQVELIYTSKNWFYYQIPRTLIRKKKVFGGQKQKWFLLKLKVDTGIKEFVQNESQEFSDFKWMSFEQAIDCVIKFKKEVYQDVYNEFKPYLKVKK